MLMPSMNTSPVVGVLSPTKIWKVVVLPAPLNPSNPKHSLSWTAKEMFFTARISGCLKYILKNTHTKHNLVKYICRLHKEILWTKWSYTQIVLQEVHRRVCKGPEEPWWTWCSQLALAGAEGRIWVPWNALTFVSSLIRTGEFRNFSGWYRIFLLSFSTSLSWDSPDNSLEILSCIFQDKNHTCGYLLRGICPKSSGFVECKLRHYITYV